MPSLPDGIVIFVLALLLFGPKKLPMLARELGKWLGEFRRASNEFKMQMEDELRIAEQAESQKKLAAIEAAAPAVPALEGIPTDEPEHPHTSYETYPDTPQDSADAANPVEDVVEPAIEPLPIATSGDLHIMPPSTGLPTPRETVTHHDDLGPLLDSIPVTSHQESETANHG